jgi:hypothetical protein
MDGCFDLGHYICRNAAHTVVLLGMLGDLLHYLVFRFAASDEIAIPIRLTGISLFLPHIFPSWPPIIPCLKPLLFQ